MNRKRIYMAQPNSQYGNSVYFPYAAGTLIAYAFEDETVASEFSFEGFFYKKVNIDEAVGKAENPFIVGFSCYVWNYEYNKALARKIKELWPDCITVFGGHQINEESDIVDADYVDYILTGEGEESFKNLLLAVSGHGELNEIPNLIYKCNGKVIKTEKTAVAIPHRVSPYLKGFFDELVKNEKEIVFSAILETNRGCPNRCAFCDWGNIKSKVRSYDLEMVFAEIDWMAENKIEYCYSADANFGLFARDEEIIDYLIKKHGETGFPEKFQATYSKNNPETVFRINKRLNEAGMCKGATLSFQSLSEKVLENIYRKNMPLESFNKLMVMYSTNKISAYSEIILGLPGESYESFRDGIEQLLEYGQHMSINFFNCELLTNSIMNDPEYIKAHKIESAVIEQHQYHIVPDNKDVKEYSRIVVSTATMSRRMWVNSNVLSVFVRAFHNLGLLQCFAIYNYYENKVKYTDFYESLIEWAEKNPDTVCGKVLSFLRSKYEEILEGDGSLTHYDEAFGTITWPLDEFIFLRVVQDYDLFYEQIIPFLETYFSKNEAFGDLLEYQKAIIKTPYTHLSDIELEYDLYPYFGGIYKNEYTAPVKKKNRLLIESPEVPENMPDYARETIWFGRRGGQNIITKISYSE